MDRRLFLGFTAAVGLVSANGMARARDKAPAEWDGLTRVKSKRLDYVYLAPGADFGAYRRVMIDPTELAFQKNWVRDYNSTKMGLSGRVNDSDVQRVITEGGKVATAIFTEAFNSGGYPVVATAAEDVLRVRTAVANISVTAPDMPVAGRSRTYAGEAGQASLIVEVRDSVTGALLGRAVDHRLAGDTNSLMRNSVTNRADFRQLVKLWAKNAVVGLNTLKGTQPA
jgi:hypothetical protein